MRNVNLVLRVCCVAMSMVSASFGEMEMPSGRDFAHHIIAEMEQSESVPESAVNDLLSSIEEIEKSPCARVSFLEMSDWRKNMFKNAIQHWVQWFPQGDYRVDAIIEFEAIQCLGQIAPLYITVPLQLDDDQRLMARRQMEEIQRMVYDAVGIKLRETTKKLHDKYPFLDSDFTLDTEEQYDFLNWMREEEDDLNPSLSYPLGARDFEDVKRSIEIILKDIVIPIYEVDETSFRHLEEAKKRNEGQSAIDNVSNHIHGKSGFYLRTETVSKISDILFKSFPKAIPPDVVKEHQGYHEEFSKLFDSKLLNNEIAEKATEAHAQIIKEHQQKFIEDHGKELEMLVASQPKDPVQEVYDIPEPSISITKVIVLSIANVALIVILIILYLRHRKHGTKT